ncbi:helix-turn-helix domain-containing protein [Methylophilus sp. Leaf408]|uniref:helix-turn-helix domain-containing protein n=1 Tax=Methylophilus sp. Leaf408 TaxID=2876561 RepID=UPI001E2D8416|nr:helix-turn-helix transcriptional regulator [Methylophilus sp. Leaf408]
MEINRAFGKALQTVRKKIGLTQEDFSDTSSRTYLSTLERGLKSPTIEKVNDLAKSLNIHPLTLLLKTYANADGVSDIEKLIEQVKAEALLFE